MKTNIFLRQECNLLGYIRIFFHKNGMQMVNCSLKLHFVFQDANFENRNNFLQLKILFCNLKSIFVIQISQTFTFLRLCAYNSVTDS